MVNKHIVFLGSKPIGFTCLKYLIEQSEALHITIAGLLTRKRTEFGPGSDLLELAAEHSIPIIKSLYEIPECDILYSVQYHEILKQRHIDKARQVAVNLHMAPLPEYRGSNQFTCALLDGKTEFGTTIHKLDAGVDSGDILFQKRFQIPDNCWVNDLYETTFAESVKLFRYTLGHVVSGNYQPVPQQNLIGKFGTGFHKRNEINELKIIDLSWSAERIDRTIRATLMPGFEPPYCMVGGEKVYFSRKS